MRDNQIVEIGAESGTLEEMIDRPRNTKSTNTLSPKILNICLDSKASPISPDYVPNQLPCSLRSSLVQTSRQRIKQVQIGQTTNSPANLAI